MTYKLIRTIILVIAFVGVLFLYRSDVIAEHNINCEDALDEKACTDSYRDYLSEYDWDVEIAHAVMMAESTARADAHNPEEHKTCRGSFGLFQVACIHGHDVDDLYNAQYNIAAAYEIYKQSGWQPWGAYTNKTYLDYL